MSREHWRFKGAKIRCFPVKNNLRCYLVLLIKKNVASKNIIRSLFSNRLITCRKTNFLGSTVLTALLLHLKLKQG